MNDLGIIEVKDSPAHCRNPTTGAAVRIAASKMVALGG